MEDVLVNDCRKCKRNPAKIAQCDQSTEEDPVVSLEISQSFEAGLHESNRLLDGVSTGATAE